MDKHEMFAGLPEKYQNRTVANHYTEAVLKPAQRLAHAIEFINAYGINEFLASKPDLILPNDTKGGGDGID